MKARTGRVVILIGVFALLLGACGSTPGLGLATVMHVAESHGGSVEVESELGVGSTFRVCVPLADEGSASGAN